MLSVTCMSYHTPEYWIELMLTFASNNHIQDVLVVSYLANTIRTQMDLSNRLATAQLTLGGAENANAGESGNQRNQRGGKGGRGREGQQQRNQERNTEEARA